MTFMHICTDKHPLMCRNFPLLAKVQLYSSFRLVPFFERCAYYTFASCASGHVFFVIFGAVDMCLFKFCSSESVETEIGPHSLGSGPMCHGFH